MCLQFILIRRIKYQVRLVLVFEKRLSILANFALEIFPLTFSNAVYTEGGGARGEEEENNDSARISRCTKLDG